MSAPPPAPAAAAPAPAPAAAAPKPAPAAVPAPAPAAAAAAKKPAAPAPAPAAAAPKPAAPAAAAPKPAAPAAPAAPAPAAAGLELVSKVEESWEADGAQVAKYAVTVTNKTAAAVNDIELELANIAGLDSQWECTVIRVGEGLPALLGLPDNLKQAGGLAAGASHTIGFIVKKNAGEPAFAVKAK